MNVFIINARISKSYYYGLDTLGGEKLYAPYFGVAKIHIWPTA